MATEDEIRELKRRHGADLLGRPGVSGVGVERDEALGFVLTLHLASDEPALRAGLPAQIEGHPIRYCAGGPYRWLAVEDGD